MTFSEAYRRFPSLRGGGGAIHIQPARSPGLHFPDSHYEHIPDAMHAGDWRNDVLTPDRDAFFVCQAGSPALDCWLGGGGPVVSAEILGFLKRCNVYGRGFLSTNAGATYRAPIRHGRLYTGLHLETNDPGTLMALVNRLTEKLEPQKVRRQSSAGGCKSGAAVIRRGGKC
jgi:hypothetical protein